MSGASYSPPLHPAHATQRVDAASPVGCRPPSACCVVVVSPRSLIGGEGAGVSDMLFDMIQAAPIDLRPEVTPCATFYTSASACLPLAAVSPSTLLLPVCPSARAHCPTAHVVTTQFYKQIVLSGGSTMYAGFPTRLETDMRKRYLTDICKGAWGRYHGCLQGLHLRARALVVAAVVDIVAAPAWTLQLPVAGPAGDQTRLAKLRLRIEDPPRRKHMVGWRL